MKNPLMLACAGLLYVTNLFGAQVWRVGIGVLGPEI